MAVDEPLEKSLKDDKVKENFYFKYIWPNDEEGYTRATNFLSNS